MASPHQMKTAHRTARDGLAAVLARWIQCRRNRVLQLLQDHSQGPEPGEALGGVDKKEPDSLVDSVFAAKKKLQDWGAATRRSTGSTRRKTVWQSDQFWGRQKTCRPRFALLAVRWCCWHPIAAVLSGQLDGPVPVCRSEPRLLVLLPCHPRSRPGLRWPSA